MPEEMLMPVLWWGLMGLTNVVSFASLAWEVARAMEKCYERDDDEAFRIVRATLNWAGVAFLVAMAAQTWTCVALVPHDDNWRGYFGLGVSFCGAQVAYMRNCEKGLKRFMTQVLRGTLPTPA